MVHSGTRDSLASADCSLDNLRDVFIDGEAIYAVADDDQLCATAADLGCRPLPLAGLADLPAGANVVLFLERSFITAGLRRALGGAAVLVVPISSFDSRPAAALYTLELVFRTNYGAACARNRRWVEWITAGSEPLVFSSQGPAGRSGTDLTCRLGTDLRGDTCLKPQLSVGDWVSVGTYCEFSLVATGVGDEGSLDVGGVADVAGVLVAQDARATPAGAARCQAGRRLREAMTGRGPVTLRLDDGKLASVTAGGTDFTAALLEVVSPEYGADLIELGIGTNSDILPWVNWSVNSQLNEGAGPVHLGFGDGITGAHVDFLIKDCVHGLQEHGFQDTVSRNTGA